MKSKVHLLVLVMSFVTCVSSAQLPQSLIVHEATLSNGLKVWLNEDHSQPVVFGAVVVNAGAKDCPDTGIAHYFEHIMFKGTDCIGTVNYEQEKVLLDSISYAYDRLAAATNPQQRHEIQMDINRLNLKASEYAIPNEFNALISKYGGTDLNAGTSYDFTFYHNYFTPQYIEQWCMLNSQRFINPVFRMFQGELETVYEEKNMESDNMVAGLRQVVMMELFGSQPYAYPIIGSTENLKNPKLSDMKRFYEKYYVGCNMGLVLCGDFRADVVFPILQRTFGRIPKGQLPERTSSPMPDIKQERTVQVKMPIPLVSIEMLAMKTPTFFDPDANAMDVITDMLSNGQAGMLDSLVSEGSLLMAHFSSLKLNDAGVGIMFVVPNLLAKTRKAEAICTDQFQRLMNGDFLDETFNTCKQKIYRDALSELEIIDGKAKKMVEVMSTGHKWHEYLDKVNSIGNLTRDDLVVVAKKYFSAPFIRFKKKNGSYDKDRVTQPGYRPVVPKNRDAMSEYALLLEQIPVKTVPQREINLDNVAIVTPITPSVMMYSVKNEVNDMFELEIAYNRGKRADRKLAVAVSMMGMCGTDSLKKHQLEAAFQKLGASVEFECNSNFTTITVKGVDRLFDATMQLVQHLLTRVQPDEVKMLQVRKAVKAEEKTLDKDNDDVMQALILYMALGKQSPKLQRLTYEELKSITSKQLIETFSSVKDAACTVTYTGSLPVAHVADMVRLSLPYSEDVKPYCDYESNTLTYDEPVVFIYDMPKSRQNLIVSYYQIEPLPTKEGRAMAQILNSYVGGGMSSVLFQEIREFRAMAYSTSSILRSTSFLLHPQDPLALITFVGTQADKSMDVIALADSLMNNLPMREKTLITAKQDNVNGIYNDFPTFRQLPKRISKLRLMGYKEEPNSGLKEIYDNITLDDFKTFYDSSMKKHISKRLIGIVGNKKTIDLKALEKYGRVVILKEKDLFRK